MKKQFKKIIAILLSFYVFFFVFVNAFALVTLDVYYSESMTIGRWSTTPFIYHQKLSSNESFPFVQGLVHGIQQWNPTLGIFVTTTTLNTNAPIKFYGGTYNNLLNTGMFTPAQLSSNDGLSIVDESTWEPSESIGAYKGGNYTTAYIYIYHNVKGFVKENGYFYNNYIKTATHELGHSFGWHLHPDNYLNIDYSSWVMKPGQSSNTTLQEGEKRHLGQIYPNSPYYDTN